MRVAIIDYGSGNLHSALKATERAAGALNCDIDISLTNNPEQIAAADRIILPGVGAFADCKSGLMAVNGVWDAIQSSVMDRGRPFLGICVGMQLLANKGLEKQVTEGFGWIDGQVELMRPSDPALKIPQIGWNTLHKNVDHAVLDGINTGAHGLHAYFVHSYHLNIGASSDLIATTDYGGAVTAIVAKDNIVGTQFHPEKSQKLGLALLANFLRWSP